VHSTTEPSHGQPGEITRHRTDVYAGHALACLVAADRYHHLSAEIRPKLQAGYIVVCDRYIASSYVLQRMDGVPIDSSRRSTRSPTCRTWQVVLTADPLVTVGRIERRGGHNRFESGLEASRTASCGERD
jgi:dTMP kinase